MRACCGCWACDPVEKRSLVASAAAECGSCRATRGAHVEAILCIVDSKVVGHDAIERRKHGADGANRLAFIIVEPWMRSLRKKARPEFYGVKRGPVEHARRPREPDCLAVTGAVEQLAALQQWDHLRTKNVEHAGQYRRHDIEAAPTPAEVSNAQNAEISALPHTGNPRCGDPTAWLGISDTNFDVQGAKSSL